MNDRKEELKQTAKTFQDLEDIMRILRSPEGCPWDREQNHESIRQNMLEEAYEACDAIDTKDATGLCEELGDLLMQVIFHAQIAEDAGTFTMEDVLKGVCEKLIIRHPHVFGEVHVNDSAEVLTNWESIKNQTKGMETLSDTLNAVAGALPELMRAQKLYKRTKKAGVSPQSLMPLAKTPKEAFGERLFLLACEANEAGIDAEEALSDYNKLYISRA